MAQRVRVKVRLEGENTTKLRMIDSRCTIQDFLNIAREWGNRGDLAYVFLNGCEIPLDESFGDFYDPNEIFYVASTRDPPPDLSVSTSGAGTPGPGTPGPAATPGIRGTPRPAPTPTPTPTPPVISTPPSDGGAGVGTGGGRPGVEQSATGVSPATLDVRVTGVTDEPSGPIKVYMTTDYESMVKGEEIPVDMDWDVRSLTDALMPIVRGKTVIKDPVMLHVFLPGGIPFTKGKLKEFFAVPEFSHAQVRRAIYVVVTRRIADGVLNRSCVELCDCSSEDMKLLLAPVVPQSEIGLTHMACLLGYLRHGGLKSDDLLNALAVYTGFAPLISNMFRIMDTTVPIYGRNIVAVTAPLFCMYSYLIPPSPDKLFEYVLRCSCWLSHAGKSWTSSTSFPMVKMENDPTAQSMVARYFQATNQDATIMVWDTDLGKPFSRNILERPKEVAIIENVFNLFVSFKPVAPLSLRTVTGATICQGKDGRTLLYVSDSYSKTTNNEVVVVDPVTGKSSSRDVEQMAREVGVENKTAALIDPDRVRQIIFVCFDESGSMSESIHGRRCKRGEGEADRVTIATQYLTTFANRTFAYRTPCIQGLISFNSQIKVRCPLSPLVPDFEDGIAKVEPKSTTHLWDALEKAADELVAYAFDGKKKKYPNARLRILVISDGDDVGSTAKPWDVCKKLIRSEVVVDSVIISTEETCKTLGALCHMTGGMACRPPTVEEGLSLFEQEAFLCLEERKAPARWRKDIDEAVVNEQAEKLVFDVAATNKIISAAEGTQPAATPRHMCNANRSGAIPDARRRRILRELHYASAVMDPSAKGMNQETGKEESVYDPYVRVYPFRSNLDTWRVYIKGVDSTPYENKWWYICVTFPDTYPQVPPVFRFVSVPYHLNVSSEGRVCLNMLEKGYRADAVVVELIQSIRQLFVYPDPNTPVQISRLDQYKNNPGEYFRLARQSADLYAKPTVDDWLKGLVIEDRVDANFTLGISVDATPPYLKSQVNGKYVPPERRVSFGASVVDVAEVGTFLTSSAGLCPITGNPLSVPSGPSDFQ